MLPRGTSCLENLKEMPVYLKTKGSLLIFRAGYANSSRNLPLHLVFFISSVTVVARSVGYPSSSYLNDIKLFSKIFCGLICGLIPSDFMFFRDKNARLSQATIKRADTTE